MDPRKFIWIVGHSASGKATLGERLASDPGRLSALIELPCASVVYRCDPPPAQVERDAAAHDAILLKWQCANFRKVIELQDRRPNDFHVVIHVRRELAEHRAAFQAKHPHSTFEFNFRFNTAVCEAYRGFVFRYVDVANIGGEFHPIGMTRRESPENWSVLRPDRRAPLADAILASMTSAGE